MVDFVACNFFTSQNLNVLLQPFVAVEFERTTKKSGTGSEGIVKQKSIPTLRKSIVDVDAGAPSGAVDALRSCTPGKIESVRTNGAAIFLTRCSRSSSHLFLTSPVTKSFNCQTKPKFRKFGKACLRIFFFLTSLNLSVTNMQRLLRLSVDHG